jgi:hypothetical protein
MGAGNPTPSHARDECTFASAPGSRTRLMVWAQVVRVAWMLGAKAGVRERERRRLVEGAWAPAGREEL